MTKAVILFSGGLDSTVVLALALEKKRECYALSFDYGQKHVCELESAAAIAAYYGISHTIISIPCDLFKRSSLVSGLATPPQRSLGQIFSEGVPSTYVPARNTLFLAYGLGFCESISAQELHFGPNRSDAFCYPDCTPKYLSLFSELMGCATQQSIEGTAPILVTPCLEWNKEEIIRQGIRLKVPLEMTWSCYSPLEGRACKKCDACLLRQKGLEENLM